MNRKLITLLWLSGCLAGLLLHAQERPVKGYFADGRGALRVLLGTQGAWEAPMVIPEGVLSAGFDGKWLWYKTQDRLYLKESQGMERSFPAPEGPATARRNRETGRMQFAYSATGEVVEFDGESQLLHIAEIAAGEENWAEWIGPGLRLLRTSEGVFSVDEGGRTTLLPLAELPPFQLLHRDGTAEVPVSGTFLMPPAAPGESSTARFRIRNTSSTAIVITRLSIDPSPFRTFDQFFPPRTMEPGGFADFSIRFSPPSPGEYVSTLHVNDFKVTLVGNSNATSSVELETPTGWLWLRAGETVSLGSVERRSVLTRRLRITPAMPASISGSGFSLSAGENDSTYIIRFVSDRVGVNEGVLQVESRTFPLQVNVTDFPPPQPSLQWLDQPAPAKQVKFRVKLPAPARAEVAGLLTVTFTPDAGLPDDGAVMLLPNAVRSVVVRIPEGASESGDLTLQTGTTAGVIRVRIAMGTNSAEESIRIGAMPVVLEGARALFASANAQITLSGYDTSRSAARVSFTFYLKSGQPAAPGRIDVDVRTAFADYYKTVSGSAFVLRAHFPVSGTHTELESVEVEIVNSAGATSTGRLRIE